MTEDYEIRVTGLMGPAARASFEQMAPEPVPQQTVLRCRVRDEAGPLDVMERLQRLGLRVTCLRLGRCPARRST